MREIPICLSHVEFYAFVAGGTAGCVLARRLSEDKKSTVLLVERGDASDSLWDRIPLLSCWPFCYKSHRNELEHKSEAFERPTKLITGIGLGGTSRINYMQYTRGAPGEYNAWSVNGRKGWSYQELLPYFEKTECLHDSKSSAPHYGTYGSAQSYLFPNNAAQPCHKLGPWMIKSPADSYSYGYCP